MNIVGDLQANSVFKKQETSMHAIIGKVNMQIESKVRDSTAHIRHKNSI